MNLSEITDGLNDKQNQSVTLGDAQNALILAGAGSGKTRVFNTPNCLFSYTEKHSY